MDISVYLQVDGGSGKGGLRAGGKNYCFDVSVPQGVPKDEGGPRWDIGMVLIHEPPRYVWGYELWECEYCIIVPDTNIPTMLYSVVLTMLRCNSTLLTLLTLLEYITVLLRMEVFSSCFARRTTNHAPCQLQLSPY